MDVVIQERTIRRLKIIEDQVRDIQCKVADDADCGDVMMRLMSTQADLGFMVQAILKDFLNRDVVSVLCSQDATPKQGALPELDGMFRYSSGQ